LLRITVIREEYALTSCVEVTQVIDGCYYVIARKAIGSSEPKYRWLANRVSFIDLNKYAIEASFAQYHARVARACWRLAGAGGEEQANAAEQQGSEAHNEAVKVPNHSITVEFSTGSKGCNRRVRAWL
jgi:hypothetical protein